MTSISVKDKTWEELNRLTKSGDTMDDVISRILEFYSEQNSNDETETISDEEFEDLLSDLIVDEDEFQNYLDKTHKSFKRKAID